MRRRFGAGAALTLMLAALALVVLGARSDTTRFQVTTVATPAQTPTVTPTPTPAGSADPVPTADRNPDTTATEGFALLYFVLVVLLVLAFVVLVFPQIGGRPSRRRRRATPAVAPSEPAEASARALDEAVEQGLREVEQGPTADAIVACWLRLERAAADAGTTRRAAETAGELTARVLAAHRVTPATLRRLADLYREARFSGHTLGEPEREQARRALEQVRRELRGHTEPAREPA